MSVHGDVVAQYYCVVISLSMYIKFGFVSQCDDTSFLFPRHSWSAMKHNCIVTHESILPGVYNNLSQSWKFRGSDANVQAPEINVESPETASGMPPGCDTGVAIAAGLQRNPAAISTPDGIMILLADMADISTWYTWKEQDISPSLCPHASDPNTGGGNFSFICVCLYI